MPKVFVASSGEALRVAKAIQQNLKGVEVKLWSQNAFRPGHNVIDELSKNLRVSDFGIFVFAHDDVITIRGHKQQAVRDNVLLELGMFIGRLGKERSFIVKPTGKDMRLPTDLLGVTTAEYDAQWAREEAAAALGDACTQIEDAINSEQESKRKELSQMIAESLETVCWSMSAPVTPERASLRAFIFKHEGNELVCVGFWDPYQSLEEVGVTRFRVDKKTAAKVVVVRCLMTKKTTSTGSDVSPLPSDLKGVKGEIRPSIEYVLASPIRNRDGTVWGVVDFDASNAVGKNLLKKEKTANAVIMRLARDLSRMLAH